MVSVGRQLAVDRPRPRFAATPPAVPLAMVPSEGHTNRLKAAGHHVDRDLRGPAGDHAVDLERARRPDGLGPRSGDRSWSVIRGCGQVHALRQALAHRAAFAARATCTPAPRPARRRDGRAGRRRCRAGTGRSRRPPRSRRRRAPRGRRLRRAAWANALDHRCSVGWHADDDHVHREELTVVELDRAARRTAARW